MHHLDVYRLEHLNEALDLGLGEMLDDGAVVIEWGDAIVPALPADYLEVRLVLGDADDERWERFRCVGQRWAAASSAPWPTLARWGTRADPRHRDRHGPGRLRHRRARGRARLQPLRPRPAPRRVARARHRVHLPAGPHELDEIGVVAVDLGPGLFTGLRVGVATAKAIAQALRVPMIGVPSLDLLAFPAGSPTG